MPAHQNPTTKPYHRIASGVADAWNRFAYFGRDTSLFANAEGRQVLAFCKAVRRGQGDRAAELGRAVMQAFPESASLRERLARAMNSDQPGVSEAIAKLWITGWYDGYLVQRLPHAGQPIDAQSCQASLRGCAGYCTEGVLC